MGTGLPLVILVGSGRVGGGEPSPSVPGWALASAAWLGCQRGRGLPLPFRGPDAHWGIGLWPPHDEGRENQGDPSYSTQPPTNGQEGRHRQRTLAAPHAPPIPLQAQPGALRSLPQPSVSRWEWGGYERYVTAAPPCADA
jgi:hypothetical protein